MMPSRSIWRELSGLTEGRLLERGILLDHIGFGWPIRAPYGGWGFSCGDDGCIEFPDTRRAAMAIMATPGWIGAATSKRVVLV